MPTGSIPFSRSDEGRRLLLHNRLGPHVLSARQLTNERVTPWSVGDERSGGAGAGHGPTTPKEQLDLSHVSRRHGLYSRF